MKRPKRSCVRATESSASSSDEIEHQKTMNIIAKMSKKFLESSKTKSSTPVNCKKVTRSRTKNRQSILSDTAYEGDLDSSISPSSTSDQSPNISDSRKTSSDNLSRRRSVRLSQDQQSLDSPALAAGKVQMGKDRPRLLSPLSERSPRVDKKSDLYEFDPFDEENLCLVLFPDSSAKSKKAQGKGKKVASSSEKRKSSATKKTSTNSYTKLVGHRSVDIADAVKRVGIKRKESMIAPSPGAKRNKPHPKVTPDVSLIDSGVFMSPIERVPGNGDRLNTPSLTTLPSPSLSGNDTTTPDLSSITASSTSISGRLRPRAPPPAAVQYDSLLEAPPSLSPVKCALPAPCALWESPPKVAPEPMDTGSPKFKTPLAEKNYSHRGQFMTPLERKEKQQKARCKPRVTAKRIDAWADKMNAEFNEIEMYDLSIENQ